MNPCILEITPEEGQVLLRVLSIVEKGLREFIDSSKTNKETRESGETELATIANLKIKIADAGAKADISGTSQTKSHIMAAKSTNIRLIWRATKEDK